METEFMKVKDVAQYLQLKPLAIYRKVKRKEIPFLKAGRSIRFKKEDLDHWMRWGSL